MKETEEIHGKVVVITGAAGGIGSATVKLFDKAGSSTIMVDYIDPPSSTTGMKLYALYQELKNPPDIGWFNCDVRKHMKVQLIVERIVKRYGKIDVLVNAAGVMWSHGVLVNTPIDAFGKLREMMDINFWGTVYWCHAVLPFMRDAGFGRIVNVSSIVANSADVGNWAYGASKAAISHITKTFAHEAPFHKNGPLDITVNAVAPGITNTDMTKGLTEKYWARYITRVPSQRKAAPEEIADAIYFLANNAYMNGEILHIDGGYSAM
ncbi:MAG: SDR family oxidoreductase [Candidatus Niyogibacteria bacterium]|nr:SDR family oxidoreductase [Candidatus Niyogibacteria bacterium]